MTKVSFKKLSVLGLVLMAASAVTAAILPSRSGNQVTNSADNGTLRSQSGVGDDINQNIKSCVADNAGDLVQSCHMTGGSATGVDSSVPNEGLRTAGNTSNSDGIRQDNDDTTSVVS